MPSCTTPIRLQLKPAYERMRQMFTFASSDRNKVKAEADDPKTKLAPPPHFVTYSDESNPPDVSKITGFNIFALSFLLLSGPADQALEWTLLSASKRTQIKNSYAAAGIKIIVSAFGSTDAPTSVGADPVKTANTMAAWVKQWGLDGIDVDYEDFNAFNDGTTRAVTWIVSFTKQLRSKLPVEQYIITHAPVAPWFQKGYAGGGYLSVHTQVGNQINWYNVQFYNQESEYETIDGLLNKSGPTYPGSALFQIHANGVAMEKLVIGKPAAKSDAIGGGQGFMSTTTLAQAVAQAAQKGWNGGVMTWEFPRGNASWIKTVRGSTFPE